MVTLGIVAIQVIQCHHCLEMQDAYISLYTRQQASFSFSPAQNFKWMEQDSGDSQE